MQTFLQKDKSRIMKQTSGKILAQVQKLNIHRPQLPTTQQGSDKWSGKFLAVKAALQNQGSSGLVPSHFVPLIRTLFEKTRVLSSLS